VREREREDVLFGKERVGGWGEKGNIVVAI
jgi:hypothetical protein